MALPLAPIALTTLRIGGLALAAYALGRISVQRAPYDQRAEEALDDVSEGIATRFSDKRNDTTLRWQRTIRLGDDGPGFSIDACGIFRVRIRRV